MGDDFDSQITSVNELENMYIESLGTLNIERESFDNILDETSRILIT